MFPKTLDHYKVYRLADVEKVPDVTLKLRDQFGANKARLRLPLYFAVPVRKRHDAKEYPIQNERAHLLIFGITPRNLEKKVTLRNQFTKGTSVAMVTKCDAGRAQHQTRVEAGVKTTSLKCF